MTVNKITSPVSPLEEIDKINEIIDNLGSSLPDQTGQAGKYLTTDGTDASWGTVDALPSQTGNANKFLTTNGTTASWGDVATRNIGEIVASTIPLTDAGLHLLDGTLISGSGSYADFVDYMAGLASTDVWSPNITTVGSLADNNGVVSGFSSSNYGTLPESFNPQNSSWEVNLKFTTGADTSTRQSVLGNIRYVGWSADANSYGVCCHVYQDKVYVGAGDGTTRFGFWSQGSTTTLQSNTTYYVKMLFDGTETYTLQLSTDGTTYNTEATFTSSQKVAYSSSYPYTYIGITNYTNLEGIAYPFSGSIDLSQCSIKINNILWWAGANQVPPSYFCTETDWQTAVSTYGVCGKFVYDSVANTVRLPKITGFTEATIDTTTLGDLTEAGLPNVSESVPSSVKGDFGTSNNAVFKLGSTQTGFAYGGGMYGATSGFVFDLSKGNSIYGNSNTVQPQSTKVLYYIVVATSTKTDIQVDIDEITTDLNGKMDSDLSNMSASSSAKNTITSWGTPDLSSGVSKSHNTLYQAETDGIIRLCIGTNNNSIQFRYGENSSVSNVLSVVNGAGVTSITGDLFVPKGTYYQTTGALYTSHSSMSNTIIFYPLKGAV